MRPSLFSIDAREGSLVCASCRVSGRNVAPSLLRDLPYSIRSVCRLPKARSLAEEVDADSDLSCPSSTSRLAFPSTSPTPSLLSVRTSSCLAASTRTRRRRWTSSQSRSRPARSARPGSSTPTLRDIYGTSPLCSVDPSREVTAGDGLPSTVRCALLHLPLPARSPSPEADGRRSVRHLEHPLEALGSVTAASSSDLFAQPCPVHSLALPVLALLFLLSPDLTRLAFLLSDILNAQHRMYSPAEREKGCSSANDIIARSASKRPSAHLSLCLVRSMLTSCTEGLLQAPSFRPLQATGTNGPCSKRRL